MLAYGATLYRIEGFGIDPTITTDAMEAVRRLGSRPGSQTQVSSYVFSPKGMSGVKTLSYELAEQLGPKIDHVFCPAGGGGMALAVARGFADLAKRNAESPSPRVEVVQPAGNDTIASALRDGADKAREVRCTTRVSGLQVPNVLDGTMALQACRASGGTGHVVSDEEIWQTHSSSRPRGGGVLRAGRSHGPGRCASSRPRRADRTRRHRRLLRHRFWLQGSSFGGTDARRDILCP